MEKCYEYFKCTKIGCPAYGKKELLCWETENTLCSDKSLEIIVKHRKNKCKHCLYFKSQYYQPTSSKNR